MSRTPRIARRSAAKDAEPPASARTVEALGKAIALLQPGNESADGPDPARKRHRAVPVGLFSTCFEADLLLHCAARAVPAGGVGVGGAVDLDLALPDPAAVPGGAAGAARRSGRRALAHRGRAGHDHRGIGGRVRGGQSVYLATTRRWTRAGRWRRSRLAPPGPGPPGRAPPAPAARRPPPRGPLRRRTVDDLQDPDHPLPRPGHRHLPEPAPVLQRQPLLQVSSRPPSTPPGTRLLHDPRARRAWADTFVTWYTPSTATQDSRATPRQRPRRDLAGDPPRPNAPSTSSTANTPNDSPAPRWPRPPWGARP